MVALLTGSKEGAFQSNDGKVTVDLSQIGATLRKDLDRRGITVFDKVPRANAPTLVLFQSTQLVRIQGLIRFLNRLYVLLPILTLLLFAAGIALTANRRRGLVRAATGLALSMALILVISSVARNHYLTSLSPSQSKPAASAVIDAISASLLDTVRIIFIVGAVIAIVGVIVGNAWIRAWLGSRHKPSWMTGGPAHDFIADHRKGLQWGIIGLGLLTLVVWNQPTALGRRRGRAHRSGPGRSGRPVRQPSDEAGDGRRSRFGLGAGPPGPYEMGSGPAGEGAVAALGPGSTDTH